MAGESKSLPIEILDRIFQHLSQKSLLQCQIVCRLWCSRATRHFLNHVTFHNSDEIKKFLSYQPRMTSAVKKLEIKNMEQHDIHLENVKKFILNAPNLQELVLDDNLPLLNYLTNTNLHTNLTSITVSYINNTTNIEDFIAILTKFRDTIQKLSLNIDNISQKWDMPTFFASFPKLTKLNVSGIHRIISFADCLPIIQAVSSLESINVYSSFDIDPDLDIHQFKHRLSELKKLTFNAPMLFPHTLSLIMHHCVNLIEIKTSICDFNLITNPHYSAMFFEFLDFIYTRDMYHFRFGLSHKFYSSCLSNVISNTFSQLPRNSQNLSRQLFIIVQYISVIGSDIYHRFRLDSDRDYCNRLQRRIKWDIQFDKSRRNELVKCIASLDKINADILVFDMCGNPSRSRCFDIFFEFLSLLIEPKRVILRVSMDSEWCRYKSLKQFDHISQLEIQVIVDEDDDNNLALFFDMLPKLKILRLIYIYETPWYSQEITYSLDLPLLHLETLYLDVTLVISQAKRFNRESFLLMVETNTLFYSYEVSITSLQVTEIKQLDPENNYFPELHITIQSVQNLYLQVLGNMVDELGPINPYYPLSPTFVIKETLISL